MLAVYSKTFLCFLSLPNVKSYGVDVINKLSRCINTVRWNKALSLDDASHKISLDQSEYFISA